MREGIGSRRYGKLGAAVMAFALVCGVVPSAPAEELTDDDFRVRVSAALLLGRQKPPGARERLEKALSDPHPAVRIAAANGLSQLGDAAAGPALERAAQREQMVGVKAKMTEALAGLRQGAGGGAGAAAAPASLDGKRFVLQLGAMRNNTAIKNEKLGVIMRTAAKSQASGIRGAVVADAGDAALLAKASEKKLPVLLLDGQLNRLSQTKSADGTFVLSAQVEFSLRRVPEHTLRGTLSGGASTQGSAKALADEARMTELQSQVVQGAVESALKNADTGLATAAR